MDHFTLFVHHATEVIGKQSHYWLFKLPICFFLAGFSFFLGVENQSMLVALLTLMTFDLLMGLSAAYMSGEEIQSRRVLKSASKLAVYAILCSGAYMVEGIMRGTTLVDEMMISFLALTEFVSIMENASRMGFSVPTKLLNKIQDLRGAK